MQTKVIAENLYENVTITKTRHRAIVRIFDSLNGRAYANVYRTYRDGLGRVDSVRVTTYQTGLRVATNLYDCDGKYAQASREPQWFGRGSVLELCKVFEIGVRK